MTTAITAAAAMLPHAADAKSCSQQGEECRSWARNKVSAQYYDRYINRCSAETNACIARCKTGIKVFVDVFDSPGSVQQYPIDECR
ncbi:hypothetical protein SSBR45G_68840 [Bradyrhizobium sp. SSBR45G]|uniref:hypothetical protein n=1 Tax=unclassified Bradyrhizobium TaxID=2631580 RepID=UPI002342B3FA|nr:MULTISPECIES: hypothetical protein [unclassified Bradyrhizobium]GLH81975.1 hypothetical protein SSBR45G_68840 [Bradyrhizobium sp. SSBR45G]GLH89422.1 hypothetical protein SSBR45R_68830 [Bradyrhizobium sp. SSBR45R]